MRFPAFGLVAAAVVVVVSVGGAPGSPVPKHLMKGEDPNLQPLQGQWKLTRLALGGEVLQAEADIVLEFRGSTLSMVSEQQNRRFTAPLKLDAKANPPRLTWSEAKATNLKGEAIKDEQAEKPGAMLYKLEADTLVLAARTGDQAQAPKGFGGKDEPNVVTLTFTRVKK